MKKKIAIVASLCLILTMGFNFADDEEVQTANPEEEFFEDDNAKGFNPETMPEIVYVGVGGLVEFNLSENPTTGYTWHISMDDPGMVEIEIDEYLTPYPITEVIVEDNLQSEDERSAELSPQPVGKGGVHRYVMRLDHQGMVKVTFEYFRDWEQDNIAETKEMTINVVPDGELVLIVNFNQTEAGGLPEPILLSVDGSVEGIIEVEESPPSEVTMSVEEDQKNLNVFQKLIRWLLDIFR